MLDKKGGNDGKVIPDKEYSGNDKKIMPNKKGGEILLHLLQQCL